MEKLIYKISTIIGKNNNFDDEKINVISDGLTALSQTACIFILSLILGLVCDCFYESMVVFFCVGILRKYTAGVHSESLYSCLIISVIAIFSMAMISRYAFILIPTIIISRIISMIVCFILFSLLFFVVYKYAPVDTPNKPLKKPEKIKRLKKGSRLITILYFTVAFIFIYFSFIQIRFFTTAVSIVMATGWQTMTLTKSGKKIINKLDDLMHFNKT